MSDVFGEHVDEEVLSGLLDGEAAPSRAAELRAHLERCAPCARIYDELAEVRGAARDMASVAPPAGLFERVMAEVLPAEVAPASTSTSTKPGRESIGAAGSLVGMRRGRGRRWLVAGASVLVMAAAVTLWVMKRGDRGNGGQAPEVAEPERSAPAPAPAAAPALSPDEELMASATAELARGQEHYTRAIAELKTLAARERVRWSPEVARSFDDSLAEIDRAVERTRQLASSAPADPDSQDALVAAYRRQVDFLEEMLVRGAVRGNP